MKLWNHSLVVGLLVAGMFGASAGGAGAEDGGGARLDQLSDVGEAGRAGAVPDRREGALQLRIRHRRRGLPRRAEGRSRRSRSRYWGEAMSYNHPLWAQQDLPAARKVLERLAPTAAARAAKAPAGKERELIESIEILFGAGDKLARDIAYADALKTMHAKYPADDEIACLYALALLGTGRPGVSNTRNAMQAAAIAQGIFQRNPKHPGAAHYIIHSFDDPDHAILSLTAAREYSKIAPSAAHALHMPSHIFVQLGMWDDVIASNVVAYKAAVDLADAKNLPRGREDFHTLSWLQYAYLQEGKFDEAQKCVDQAKAVADKDTAPNIRDGYAAMKARQVVESARWEKLALPTGPVKDGGAPGYDGSAAYVLAAGLSAAKLGDLATANVALDKLKAMRTQAESGSNAYRAKPFAIMEKEVAAAIALGAEGHGRRPSGC